MSGRSRPRVLAVVGPQHPAVDDLEVLAELVVSSRCHWCDEVGRATMSMRSASPRMRSSLRSRPAMIVLPAPGSSARRKRMSGDLRK